MKKGKLMDRLKGSPLLLKDSRSFRVSAQGVRAKKKRIMGKPKWRFTTI